MACSTLPVDEEEAKTVTNKKNNAKKSYTHAT